MSRGFLVFDEGLKLKEWMPKGKKELPTQSYVGYSPKRKICSLCKRKDSNVLTFNVKKEHTGLLNGPISVCPECLCDKWEVLRKYLYMRSVKPLARKVKA